MEQELLRANSAACERFYDKYVDSRGYLLHTPRWGTLDGPDDAVETFFNWTLLHALGGKDSLLDMWRKAYDGHLAQYSELRTVKTELAKDGAYFNEFITQSDWFHTGEGLRAFFLQGLSDPKDEKLIARMKRFAGIYMNEDPEAPNYDPQHKVIKSIWTGSKGPMLRKATTYDWVGDPVPGRFHLLHNPAGRGKMLDLMAYYPKMLAHCAEYLDSVGDHPLNLGATILATNAYMLTGEQKYKNWVLEYSMPGRSGRRQPAATFRPTSDWTASPAANTTAAGTKAPTAGTSRSLTARLEQIAHRNYFDSRPWPGFGNALLLTGDQSYVDVLRKQMDNIYAQKKEEDGKTLLPQMYGDPRGYKHTGREEWYHYTPNLHTDRLTEIYLWSMDRKDLERIPRKAGSASWKVRTPTTL